MVTIGYSTRSENSEFRKKIEESVGVKDFEIIEKINKGEKSLTKVYNEILREAKNDIVILCHDDIYFDKKYWGKRIIDHFNKPEGYTILGLAGTRYLPKNGKWWEITAEMVGSVNHENNGKKWKSEYSKSTGSVISEVVLIDGLFMAINKKNPSLVEFDETFDGFHFYDISFCFDNFINGNKIGVVSDIEVTHRSIGITNDEWEKNRLIFAEKNKTILPIFKFGEFKEKEGKKEKDLVSVITPIFNYGKMLNKTIDSVFNSKYNNFELIIVDDGSTDEYVLKKLSSLSGNRQIKVIRQENLGLSNARNTGIANSSGNFILPLDGDDMIHPDMISKMVLTIKSEPNLSPVYCDVVHFGEENGVEKKPEWSLERLLSGPFICASSLFTRESFMKTSGFDTKLSYWEDYDMWLQMAKNGFKGKRVDRPLFYYFRHQKEGSLSSKSASREAQEKAMEVLLKKYYA